MRGSKKKVRMTPKAKVVVAFGMVFLAVNFFLMIGLALKNGTSAFPGGITDESGSYVIDHGKRIDFEQADFRLSYYQGLVTWVAFPTFFVIVLMLYATGNIREVKED